jgi:uncharacterized spore protein YtfJ
MTTDIESAMREAQSAISGPASGFIDRFARRMGAQANASAVFGTPVERSGVTVIPVARIRWGFGGGEGTGAKDLGDEANSGEGSGGGAGVMASPVGYIEIRDGSASFERIPDPSRLVPLIIASGFTAWLTLRGLRRLLR